MKRKMDRVDVRVIPDNEECGESKSKTKIILSHFITMSY